MKIVIEEIQGNEEEQIIIKCRQMSNELLRLIAIVKAQDSLIAYRGSDIYRVNPSDIFYIEAVDNKTFLYGDESVYESKQRLYELEDILFNSDFLRVSKAVILNLSKIKSLSPALNGRFEAILANKERVIISRQYVGDLKKQLRI